MSDSALCFLWFIAVIALIVLFTGDPDIADALRFWALKAAGLCK